ncbi:hypothetical protein Cdeb_02262 [Caldibacillus debilis GB1]|uniref:Uncharacterized protein n=1 Tax=Caldibacillus debilis GB1 TaxID=1339248 RepID=A0A420VBA3_9BACI|nr:hypothetical protein Cdeb_02262 [Caldibacillus debilis GB1]
MIFHQVTGDQTDVRILVGEHPNDMGSTSNLPVQTFQHIGRCDFSVIDLVKMVELERVFQTGFQHLNRSRILSFILVHECLSIGHGGPIVRLQPNFLQS